MSRKTWVKLSLKDRIKDSLVIYHDGPKAYLRFVPLEVDGFSHGLSLNVTFKPGEEEVAKEAIAAYLKSAIELLVEREA